MLVVLFMVCFLASVVGAVCGIGGGVVIKPVLDAFHIMNVSAISFLSGCTVLSMSMYSVLKRKFSGESYMDFRTGSWLALGSVFGGFLGKWMFSLFSSLGSDRDKIGAVQAACLLVITMGTLGYTLNKDKIATKKVKNPAVCCCIGLFLGAVSSFLGIGGGPVNLVVLFFFFSMTAREAAENSLYIILFSQASSLLSSLLTGSVPAITLIMPVVMVTGGITGGMVGQRWNKKIEEKTVERLLIGLMAVIILICIYNMFIYLGR